MRSHADSEARLLSSFAPHDFTSSLAYAVGFRDWAYRRRAVDLRRLANGDRVVELGCGTGRDCSLLERAVGPGGAIIAVDVSEAMLARARKRVARHGWSNVELVLGDAVSYEYPAPVDGVLSTSTYTLVVLPENDRVIERACGALKDGKRLAVLDQKLPSGPASRLVPLWIFFHDRSTTRGSSANVGCGSPSGSMGATFESRSDISGSSTWQWVRRTPPARDRDTRG
jgi:demethylmenaquinone methyltransferase/2-methoxy-6-polyprenyl-1,4-benzoquinol methylase